MFDIKGLYYQPNFINTDEEKYLIRNIDNNQWNTSLSRRTQHYGYLYDYRSRQALIPTNAIPDWSTFVINRLIDKNIINFVPDQMIINEYKPGQGISPHIDSVLSFENGIVSLSLGSPVVMEFTKDSTSIETILERKSIIALHDDARYKWKHSIPARKSDNGVPRSRRLSLTFRKMKIN